MAGTRTLGSTLTLTKSGSEAADTVLSSLTSIGAVAGEHESIDAKTLDDENGKIAGSTSWDDIEIAQNVTSDNKTQVAALRSVFTSKATREWTITTPGGSTIVFDAFIQKMEDGERTVDGLETVTYTLAVSGTPTFTA